MAKALASTITQVKREIAARRFDQADKLLQDALSTDPDTPELHEQRGLLAYGKGDFSAALDALKVAVALAPYDSAIRFTQLRIAANSDYRDLAGDIAVEAVTAAPDDDRMLRLAAKALMKKRDYPVAGAYWRRLGERTGEVASIVEGARALVAARDYAGALDCAEEALRRDPFSDGAKLQRVRALEWLAPESDSFGNAVRAVAANDAREAIEYLPYLLSFGLHAALAGLVTECTRQGLTIDPILVPPIARAIEGAARRYEAQDRLEDAASCRSALPCVADDDEAASEDIARTTIPDVSLAHSERSGD